MMGFRIQPASLDIPRDAPFTNDFLERKETAEILTGLMGSIDGPCVLALDAAWGMGKTTFLRMWEPLLNERGFHVVTFNAWETDFASEPFLALSEELRGALMRLLGDDQAAITKLKRTASRVLQTAGSTAVRNLASYVLGPSGAEVVEEALAAFVDKRVSQYSEAKEAIEEFREALEEAASDLQAKSDTGVPLVVVIDELDRCRPTYAVELLEVLKHLCAVNGVVFVLSLNREELVHAVRAIYGAQFDAGVYLRRFIDIDVRLPDGDREAFVTARLADLRSQVQGASVSEAEARKVDGIARDWLVRFFGPPNVDLRTLEQALRRLGLMLAMLHGKYNALIKTAAFVLVFRTLERDLYDRFLAGRATDEEVADALFARQEPDYRASSEGMNLETEIIMAEVERDFAKRGELTSTSSRLLDHYRKLAVDSDAEAVANSERERAGTITRFVEAEHRNRIVHGGFGRFRGTAARLEMLSSDLRWELQEPTDRRQDMEEMR